MVRNDVLSPARLKTSTHVTVHNRWLHNWSNMPTTPLRIKTKTASGTMVSRSDILPSFDEFFGKKKFYSPTPKLVITKFAEVNNRLQWVRNKFTDVHRKVITKIPTVCEFVPITNLGQDKCQVSDKESSTDDTKEKIQITSV